jgi:hypothetical protein
MLWRLCYFFTDDYTTAIKGVSSCFGLWQFVGFLKQSRVYLFYLSLIVRRLKGQPSGSGLVPCVSHYELAILWGKPH